MSEIIGRKNAAGISIITNIQRELWAKQKPTDRCLADVRGKPNGFTDNLLSCNEVAPTITAGGKFILKKYPRWASKVELLKMGSYPSDYNFKSVKPQFLVGMSVPPVMTAQIANEIRMQWFDALKASEAA